MKIKLMQAIGSRLFYQPGFFVMILVLPILLSLVMGAVYQPQEEGAIPIAWVDEDGSEASVFLTGLMREESMVRLVETDRETAIDLVRGYQVEGAYILPEAFEETMRKEQIPQIEMLRSASSLGADAVGELIASGVIRMASHHRAAGVILREYEAQHQPIDDQEALRKEILEHAESYWEDGPPIPLQVREEEKGTGRMEDTPRGILAAPYGALVAMMTFFAASLPMVIQYEKKAGTWQRIMMVTGTEKVAYQATLHLYTLIQAFMAFVTLFVLDVFFNLSYWGKAGISLLIFAGYGYFVSALFLFSERMKITSKLGESVTFGVLLICLVSGCFWTTAIYPRAIQSFVLILPPAMAMRILEQGFIQNYLWVAVGILFWVILGIFLSKKTLKTGQ
ncbi:ABC transporter permease [Tindallia californiensis]|uniref:ABC-2 family transporter protein n=1 Tax=Tindallia californiensis TaxID=159292 RepID=A0A1H3Q1A8_9FIRM|nr:ABC transporter permease [Tindallia californiensis]SDZ07030.1 ABC-2 family transporter protein [Tindallia californiensis]